MAYRFTVYSLDRKIVHGTIDAASESMAEEALYRVGHRRVLSLQKVREDRSLEALLPTFFGVKTREVIDFTHQLATLVESGIDILAALRILEGQTSKRAFKKILVGLIGSLEGGSSFSRALGKYPEIFPHTYCQLMQASEQMGSLEVGLRQAAEYIEKKEDVAGKVKRA
ncbi:MAG: type II secretion system F family protein, partial [Dehalococcoidia bacterium]|nr:type II secretion system F family protein [Dehalococcoidia bacterium]